MEPVTQGNHGGRDRTLVHRVFDPDIQVDPGALEGAGCMAAANTQEVDDGGIEEILETEQDKQEYSSGRHGPASSTQSHSQEETGQKQQRIAPSGESKTVQLIGMHGLLRTASLD
jgi:hypothetical protein